MSGSGHTTHEVNQKLTPQEVNTQSGRWLHTFQWLPDKEADIGSIPEEWKDFVIEFDNTISREYSESLEKALKLNLDDIDFKSQITFEEKCDKIFEKCINLMVEK